MIVAVDAFNMGAMENKGLNVFNSAYVLASVESATDDNFYGIESVIGHEYFHNWTGNRITCRDWFQLTLKEGLTVFRDQEFSADLNSRPVERIHSVNRLRSAQFPEDQGPTSHPIKPSSYIEINNFYTATVYEKGAEVIRMLQTLLGVDGFRKGMDKYFELFDGQAVRTEDFLHSMSLANNNFDLSVFERWYHQNGTPTLVVKSEYLIQFKMQNHFICQF
jgi:aminopeptidase N